MSNIDCVNNAGVMFENGLTEMKRIADTKTDPIIISKISEGKEDEEKGKANARSMEKQIPFAVEKQRICLIGLVAEDIRTVLAAQTFNVPILTSVTGIEFISDIEWCTYFVMNDFEGATFDAIRKSKHRIYGPIALQQVAQSDTGLTHMNRPIYNFAMKGVITCFTGIRKKDELTRLVNLIHAMGGSIRKELNSKVTHLICNASAGEKYQYAMTFRLAVIRAAWVYEAWERRSDVHFFAIESEFSKAHRLKPFEGQRVCFFGFANDEQQEMVEILKSNGGIATDLEDPDCSHVIIANSVDHFPEQMGTTSPPVLRLTPNVMMAACGSTAASASASAINDRFLPPDGLETLDLNEKSINLKPNQAIIDTPKKTIYFNDKNSDGIVLDDDGNEENQFFEPTNLSPILHNIEEVEEEETEGHSNNDDYLNEKEISKRKRDSFDNISIISTDTFTAQFNSAKKPKLIRTSSITRSLRRSISFVALKNPITNMIRIRRNSIDPNASFTSIASMEGTFSESIKRPVKEKFQSLRDRIMTNTNRAKREFSLTPKTGKKFNNRKDRDGTDEKFALPHEINTLACGQFANSTMNTTAAFDALEALEADANQNETSAERKTNTVRSVKTIQRTSEQLDSMMKTTISKAATTTSALPDKSELKSSNTHIVKSDWFWFTIQDGYANEMDYLFGDYLESVANTPGCDRRDSLPLGINKRKRKRFSLLGASGKRRSSLSDIGLSVSGSFLDCTPSPSCKHDTRDAECNMDHTPKNKSMRYNHFMDLYGTESNYVGILHTIVSLFQKPLEDMADTNDALLNKSEVRAIFNNFSPIHEVHSQMLNHFRVMQSSWSENGMIGKIILDHREALIKAYPPYVNFFEQMKEALQQCDTQNPRFHAFLKINQAKAECGRQTLQDLMIRPVQRLPSMSLLMCDILKHTPKSNPDYKELEHALKAIKEVMTYINEDKRKTESRLALFDIFNDIDHCPADLVSSHRSFISKCEVTELSNCLSGRDDPLMLFLFTDYIEICKIRKSRGFNNIKSPTGTIVALNTTTNRTNAHTKSYKHIRLIPLSAIPCVYDINDSARAFAISNKDKLYCFNITDECEKIIYLKSFCNQLAENACRTDGEQFLRSYESHELGIDISEINFGTLKKVYNYARTHLKVSRAFSFKSTPKLKRTISPLYASTNSLIPM